jgi:hypothetical protein
VQLGELWRAEADFWKTAQAGNTSLYQQRVNLLFGMAHPTRYVPN